MKKVPLIKPYITQEIKDRVCQVLDSGYLTEGSITRKFEDVFKKYVGATYALAVPSCTLGIEIALRALKIGPGDEVIVPDYTYPATADAVAITGAKSVIVDICPSTMLIDYKSAEEAITSKTKAIIPVSLFGNPLDYNYLNKLKEKYNIYIIEDAACSLGTEFQGIRVGSLADISIFSFHPRKFITTGEGGMITTNSEKWAEWILSYKHFGASIQESRLTTSFNRIGTNGKFSDILAALGLEQMRQIDLLLARRQKLAKNYIKLLGKYKQVEIPKITMGGAHSYQSFCVFVENRNEVMNKLRNKGIETQIGTYAIHMHKAFSESKNCRIEHDMKGSKYAFDYCLTLPLYHELTTKDQEYIVQKLIQVIKD